MERITDEIREFLDRLRLGFVATTCEDGTPNLSPKGTIVARGDRHLVFADIRSPQTIRNILKNPAVEINVVDPLLRRGYRFRGVAAILEDGGEFDEILDHYKKSGVKSEIRRVVKVKVSEIQDVTSPLYDLGMDEKEIKRRWKKIYSEF